MSDEFHHICVDTETLSTKHDAVIVTIAAVKFNIYTDTFETFKVNINPRDSKRLGLRISTDTISWWRAQRPEAVSAWQHSQIDLADALDQFSAFCGSSKDMLYWANGSWFDFPILESSYGVVGKVPPYKYWNVHELRTAYLLGNVDPKKEERVGVYHDAVDDCLSQIKFLKKALGKE